MPAASKPRKKSWSRSQAGRAHASRAITAFNASDAGEAHALAVVKRWQADPLVKLKQQLHLHLLHAATSARLGHIAGAREHLDKAEFAAVELARIGDVQ